MVINSVAISAMRNGMLRGRIKMNEEVEQILSDSLTWEKLLVTCQFCYDNNNNPKSFWVTHNEYRCPACGKRGWIKDYPMITLKGEVR